MIKYLLSLKALNNSNPGFILLNHFPILLQVYDYNLQRFLEVSSNGSGLKISKFVHTNSEHTKLPLLNLVFRKNEN